MIQILIAHKGDSFHLSYLKCTETRTEKHWNNSKRHDMDIDSTHRRPLSPFLLPISYPISHISCQIHIAQICFHNTQLLMIWVLIAHKGDPFHLTYLMCTIVIQWVPVIIIPFMLNLLSRIFYYGANATLLCQCFHPRANTCLLYTLTLPTTPYV